MTHREYIQQEAEKNMAFHMENMEGLQKESNTTLTFLFVVISTAFSAAVKLFSGHGSTALATSLAILCVYLTGVAVYLVFTCLWARDVFAPANEPKNLKIPEGYTFEQIQDFELENLQVRIESNAGRNRKTAFHLNLVRLLICGSPFVFLVAITFLWLAAGLCAAA